MNKTPIKILRYTITQSQDVNIEVPNLTALEQIRSNFAQAAQLGDTEPTVLFTIQTEDFTTLYPQSKRKKP